MEPCKWIEASGNPHPLHLIPNHPSNKLHSQFDCGAVSRGIVNHDSMRVFTARGACLDATWENDGTLWCWHGNPNVLAWNNGTFRFAQGSIAQSCPTDIETFEGDMAVIEASDPLKSCDQKNAPKDDPRRRREWSSAGFFP